MWDIWKHPCVTGSEDAALERMQNSKESLYFALYVYLQSYILKYRCTVSDKYKHTQS